jgi:hypothetical protein
MTIANCFSCFYGWSSLWLQKKIPKKIKLVGSHRHIWILKSDGMMESMCKLNGWNKLIIHHSQFLGSCPCQTFSLYRKLLTNTSKSYCNLKWSIIGWRMRKSKAPLFLASRFYKMWAWATKQIRFFFSM